MTFCQSTLAQLAGARAVAASRYPERLHVRPVVAASNPRVKRSEDRILEITGGPETGTPLCLPSDLAEIARLESEETTYILGIKGKGVFKKNLRTYYVYADGVISQRKRAGMSPLSSLRATTTVEAKSLYFSQKA